MSKTPHYMPFDSIKNVKLSALEKKLDGFIVDIPAKDIPIGYLCRSGTKFHGVYLFYNEKKILQYVGKSTSRSFAERIPAHFDLRPKAWFNTLPKKMCPKEPSNVIYEEARQKALSFRLIMVGMDCNTDEGKMHARILEKVLRHYLEPRLNTPKKLNQYDPNKSLGDLLKELSTG